MSAASGWKYTRQNTVSRHTLLKSRIPIMGTPAKETTLVKLLVADSPCGFQEHQTPHSKPSLLLLPSVTVARRYWQQQIRQVGRHTTLQGESLDSQPSRLRKVTADRPSPVSMAQAVLLKHK